ncbi:MAG: bifunctional alpha/beta hydrolase/OsmC family protein [Owenweeksia sp.]|nr:bifunctional alpha/beta hydrolase/OsmC family protein [Owenweeksia sp.]
MSPCTSLSLLSEDIEKIKKEGKATVNLAGREFKIKSQFVKDLQDTGLKSILAGDGMRGKSILVMHSPQDELVEVSNARHIYQSARHPKSFISLDGANHLMTNKNDSIYAGQVIAAWAVRYLGQSEESIQSEEQVMVRLNDGPFLSEILAGSHHMLADEPAADGGSNLGPTPYEYVASGLGACTAMTIKLYTDRKEWPLEEVKVHLNYDSNYREDCENCEDEDLRLGKFERIIELKGDLDDKQQKRILQIANKCPVHKTLTKGVHIESRIKKS